MGTPMAPNYANLFMDKFETNLLDEYHKKTGLGPLVWYRYIDDVFFIWTHGNNTLQPFLDYIQNYSIDKKMKSLIKFEIHHSSESVNFLDVTVNLKNGTFHTDLYCKPTDAHLYLNATSSHPQHVIKNIPKGQFIRLRRICSDTTNYIKHSTQYIEYFTNAGYNSKKLKSIAEDVLKTKRIDLLENVDKKLQDSNTTFVCTYHPKLETLPQILKEHYKILENDQVAKKVFPEKPMVAFRKNKNIQQHIVKNDINPKNLTEQVNHKECNKSCKTCNLISNKSIIKSSTNVTYDLKSKSHCHAKNIVYAAKCN